MPGSSRNHHHDRPMRGSVAREDCYDRRAGGKGEVPRRARMNLIGWDNHDSLWKLARSRRRQRLFD